MRRSILLLASLILLCFSENAQAQTRIAGTSASHRDTVRWFGQQFLDPSPKVETTTNLKLYPPRPPLPKPLQCDSPSIKYVRVNIHWMLSSTGGGNFTEDGDNFTTNGNINGYNRAEMLVDRMNRHWRVNAAMTYPVGNTIPVIDTRIRFVLASTCFHRDDDYYRNGSNNGLHDWSVAEEYGTNLWTEINIFMVERPTNVGASGIANQWGSANLNNPLVLKCYNEWRRYRSKLIFHQNDAADPTYTGGNTGTLHGGTLSTRIISHEIGHLLSLHHMNVNPGCPSSEYNPNSTNCWSCNYSNVMDYSGVIPYAFTPCQIDRMHTVLEGDGRLYVQECGDCLPTNAFFKAPDGICIDLTPTFEIDARGSYNEDRYQLRISEVANVGDWQALPGTELITPWIPGEAGVIDIGTVYSTLQPLAPWKVYRVLLAVQNYDDNGNLCTNWDQYVDWVVTYNCKSAAGGKRNGLEDLNNSGFQLYPNPARRLISISHSMKEYSSAELILSDLTGREVLRKEIETSDGNGKLNIEQLDRGTYIVDLRVNARSIGRKKLVISK